MRNKFLTLLFVLVALVSTLMLGSISASADPEPEHSYVAQINETKYETLEDAVSAANNAGTATTVKLLDNVVLTFTEYAKQIRVTGENVTLDLNGKTISYNGEAEISSGLIAVGRGAKLTIDDFSEEKKGTIDSTGTGSGNFAFYAVAVTIPGEAGTGDPATLVVNNGNLVGADGAICGNGNRHGTAITINGGTFTATSEAREGVALYHPQEGTLTISGGTFTGYASAVEFRAGTLNITDGEFTALAQPVGGTTAVANGNGSTVTGAALALSRHTTGKTITANISGGTFTGMTAVRNVDTTDQTPVLATVTNTNALASIKVGDTTTYVSTKEAALALLNANATAEIKLLDNVDLKTPANTINIQIAEGQKKLITLDLNGKSFSADTVALKDFSILTVKGSPDPYTIHGVNAAVKVVKTVAQGETPMTVYFSEAALVDLPATMAALEITDSTITLLDDLDLTALEYPINVSQDQTLHVVLNGKTLKLGAAPTIESANFTSTAVATVKADGSNVATYYDSLAGAVAVAEAGETVTLLADVTLTAQLNITKAITLDGNEKTIISSATATGAILVTAGATLKNLTVVGPNTTNPKWDNGEFGIKFYNANGATLSGATVVTSANAGIQVNGGEVTMTGTITVSGNEFGGIELCHGGKLDISGATLVNVGETKDTPVLWNDDTKGTLTLNAKQSLFATAVETDKDHYYLSLECAVAAADDNETVTLLGNATLSEQLIITKAIVLDGNGFEIKRVNTTGVTDPTLKGTILVSAGATLKNLKVVGLNTQPSGWDEGEFGIKFFGATDAKLNNVTVSDANAGIQVNGGKVTMTGTITVSGNEFGGIELCKSGILDITGATLVNEGETKANPVLWNDDTKGTLLANAAQSLFVTAEGANKDHYYLTFKTIKEYAASKQNAAVIVGLTAANTIVPAGTKFDLPANVIFKLENQTLSYKNDTDGFFDAEAVLTTADGSKFYLSDFAYLPAVMSELGSTCTIKLLKDVAITAEEVKTIWGDADNGAIYIVNKDVTFDLNGKTFTADNAFGVYVGEVTFKSGTAKLLGDVVLANSGKLTLDEGALVTASKQINNEDGLLTVNFGAKLTGTAKDTTATHFVDNSKANAQLSDGTYINFETKVGTDDYYITLLDDVTISSTITLSSSTTVNLNGHTITVANGEGIIMTGENAVFFSSEEGAKIVVADTYLATTLFTNSGAEGSTGSLTFNNVSIDATAMAADVTTGVIEMIPAYKADKSVQATVIVKDTEITTAEGANAIFVGAYNAVLDLDNAKVGTIVFDWTNKDPGNAGDNHIEEPSSKIYLAADKYNDLVGNKMVDTDVYTVIKDGNTVVIRGIDAKNVIDDGKSCAYNVFAKYVLGVENANGVVTYKKADETETLPVGNAIVTLYADVSGAISGTNITFVLNNHVLTLTGTPTYTNVALATAGTIKGNFTVSENFTMSAGTIIGDVTLNKATISGGKIVGNLTVDSANGQVFITDGVFDGTVVDTETLATISGGIFKVAPASVASGYEAVEILYLFDGKTAEPAFIVLPKSAAPVVPEETKDIVTTDDEETEVDPEVINAIIEEFKQAIEKIDPANVQIAVKSGDQTKIDAIKAEDGAPVGSYVTLEITLSGVQVSAADNKDYQKISFDVTPVAYVYKQTTGETIGFVELHEINTEVEFYLPVVGIDGVTAGQYIAVYHGSACIGTYKVEGDVDSGFYVKVKSDTFSTFSYDATAYDLTKAEDRAALFANAVENGQVAATGSDDVGYKFYDSISAAVEANTNGSVIIIDDKAEITYNVYALDGNNKLYIYETLAEAVNTDQVYVYVNHRVYVFNEPAVAFAFVDEQAFTGVVEIGTTNPAADLYNKVPATLKNYHGFFYSDDSFKVVYLYNTMNAAIEAADAAFATANVNVFMIGATPDATMTLTELDNHLAALKNGDHYTLYSNIYDAAKALLTDANDTQTLNLLSDADLADLILAYAGHKNYFKPFTDQGKQTQHFIAVDNTYDAYVVDLAKKQIIFYQTIADGASAMTQAVKYALEPENVDNAAKITIVALRDQSNVFEFATVPAVALRFHMNDYTVEFRFDGVENTVKPEESLKGKLFYTHKHTADGVWTYDFQAIQVNYHFVFVDAEGVEHVIDFAHSYIETGLTLPTLDANGVYSQYCNMWEIELFDGIQVGSSIYALTDKPEEIRYFFSGWYFDDDFATAATALSLETFKEGTTMKKSIDLYAKFESYNAVIIHKTLNAAGAVTGTTRTGYVTTAENGAYEIQVIKALQNNDVLEIFTNFDGAKLIYNAESGYPYTVGYTDKDHNNDVGMFTIKEYGDAFVTSFMPLSATVADQEIKEVVPYFYNVADLANRTMEYRKTEVTYAYNFFAYPTDALPVGTLNFAWFTDLTPYGTLDNTAFKAAIKSPNTAFDLPTRTGYVLKGWVVGTLDQNNQLVYATAETGVIATTDLYNFAQRSGKEPVNFYAVWALDATCFTVDGVSTTYDGEDHYVTAAHGVTDSEDLFTATDGVTFKLLVNGVESTTNTYGTDGFKFSLPSESTVVGTLEYKVKATGTGLLLKDCDTNVKDVTVSIAKASIVSDPTDTDYFYNSARWFDNYTSFTYNGSDQSPLPASTTAAPAWWDSTNGSFTYKNLTYEYGVDYTVSGTLKAENVGSYTITVTPVASGSLDFTAFDLHWSIDRATIYLAANVDSNMKIVAGAALPSGIKAVVPTVDTTASGNWGLLCQKVANIDSYLTAIGDLAWSGSSNNYSTTKNYSDYATLNYTVDWYDSTEQTVNGIANFEFAINGFNLTVEKSIIKVESSSGTVTFYSALVGTGAPTLVAGDKVTLMDDPIAITETLNVSVANVTLDLNGNTLKWADTVTGTPTEMINVTGSLTLKDSGKTEDSSTVYGAMKSGAYTAVAVTSGALTIDGVKIEGTKAGIVGVDSAVKLDGATILVTVTNNANAIDLTTNSGSSTLAFIGNNTVYSEKGIAIHAVNTYVTDTVNGDPVKTGTINTTTTNATGAVVVSTKGIDMNGGELHLTTAGSTIKSAKTAINLKGLTTATIECCTVASASATAINCEGTSATSLTTFVLNGCEVSGNYGLYFANTQFTVGNKTLDATTTPATVAVTKVSGNTAAVYVADDTVPAGSFIIDGEFNGIVTSTTGLGGFFKGGITTVAPSVDDCYSGKYPVHKDNGVYKYWITEAAATVDGEYYLTLPEAIAACETTAPSATQKTIETMVDVSTAEIALANKFLNVKFVKKAGFASATLPLLGKFDLEGVTDKTLLPQFTYDTETNEVSALYIAKAVVMVNEVGATGNGTGFASIKDALAYVTTATASTEKTFTVKLIDDVNFASQYTFDAEKATLTIDLNDYTMSPNGLFTIAGGSKVTFVDNGTEEDKVGTVNSKFTNNGTLTLEGGQFAIISNSGKMTISADTVALTADSTGRSIDNKGDLTINGGTFAGSIDTYGASTAKITINGGKFNGAVTIDDERADYEHCYINGGSFKTVTGLNDYLPFGKSFGKEQETDEYYIVGNFQ